MIRQLWIHQFRNISDQRIALDNHRIIFLNGLNNQGKTNFLEAIYYLGNLRSLSGSEWLQLLQDNCSTFGLGCDGGSDQPFRLYIRMDREGRRQLSINDGSISRVQEIWTHLNVDYISADILHFLQGYPDARRRTMDRFIEKMEPKYRRILQEYDRIIRQKSACLALKQGGLDTWNEALVSHAVNLVAFRKKYAEVLLKKMQENWKWFELDFTDGLVGMRYITKRIDDPNVAYEKALREKLHTGRDKEIASGQCLYGPHRDDYEFLLSEGRVQDRYSRGINRFVSVLFKISQLQLVASNLKNVPVLLLDDTFAELDNRLKRQFFILASRYGQVFYTATNPDEAGLMESPLKLEIEKGHIREKTI